MRFLKNAMKLFAFTYVAILVMLLGLMVMTFILLASL